MGKPVDTQGEKIGTISDLAISTGEVFPRITSLAFQGPGKVPFMISWRKYVDTFDEDGITLNAEAHDIRFSYLQPDEVLLARDLLNRQIVDTQGLKVVRVNDLKLSESGSRSCVAGRRSGVSRYPARTGRWLEARRGGRGEGVRKKIDEQISPELHGSLRSRPLRSAAFPSRTSAWTSCTLPTWPTSSSSWTPGCAPTCSSTRTMRRQRAISRWKTSTSLTSKTSTTPAPPAFGRHGPDDAADIVARDLSYEKPRRSCASWASRTPPRSAACWATRWHGRRHDDHPVRRP